MSTEPSLWVPAPIVVRHVWEGLPDALPCEPDLDRALARGDALRDALLAAGQVLRTYARLMPSPRVRAEMEQVARDFQRQAEDPLPQRKDFPR